MFKAPEVVADLGNPVSKRRIGDSISCSFFYIRMCYYVVCSLNATLSNMPGSSITSCTVRQSEETEDGDLLGKAGETELKVRIKHYV